MSRSLTVKALLNFMLNVVSWGLVLVGCAWAADSLVDLYMILVNGAHPGDVIFLDTKARTIGQAAIDPLLGV
jgi:hypothetical protein